jgi:ubiquinone/menaquinone biosynthesis C-methylase UbiE
VNSTPNVESEVRAGIEVEPSGPAESRSVSVAEGYERWAPAYDRDPNPLLAREERHLLPLLRNLHAKRVLDLACGTGRWLERLMAQGCASGVGIDRSAAMLRVAGEKCAITGRLTRAACESLPFRGTVFDLAICSFALGHIPDLGSMVRELARVTKPKADLFVSDLHPDAYDSGWRVGFRDQSSAVQIETFSRAAEEILRPFCSHGFECVTQAPLWLEEQEKPIFVRAGKSDRFVEACQSPAVLVLHFTRLDSPAGGRRAC